MAKAVRKTQFPPPVIPMVTHLELSDDEALALNIILRHVGGDPEKSKRKFADAILKALRDARSPEEPGFTFGFVTKGSNITFRDFKNEEKGEPR